MSTSISPNATIKSGRGMSLTRTAGHQKPTFSTTILACNILSKINGILTKITIDQVYKPSLVSRNADHCNFVSINSHKESSKKQVGFSQLQQVP